MNYDIKTVELKFCIYPIISAMASVKNGWKTYEEEKEFVDNCIKKCPYNLKEYFKDSRFETFGDTPSWVGKELANEAWNALEFFKVI